MNWKQSFGIRTYLRSSLWVVPFVAIPIELLASRVVHWLDPLLGWRLLGLAVPGAQALLSATVTSTLSFVVFTFGSLLVAIQVAGAQMTPRIIATTLLRDDVVRYTVGLFIFTLLFALSAQNRMDKEPYQLVLLIAALLAISCFAAFFYLIDHASRLLRPVAVLTKVGDAGLAVIDSVYPKHAPAADIPLSSREELGPPARTVVHQGKSGILLAVNLSLLVNDAEKFDGVIELVPQVGDFVAIDDPVFNLYGGARVIDDGTLRSSVAFGSERTLQQDPTFAFRIVVDIAIRALSPAINDPTTAVLAIDQLHRMLRAVGQHHLHDDRVVGRSAKVRVIFRTPDWDDFVHIAMSEIRACGYSNIQVVRRARSMIETLLRTLPARRHPALEQELGLLNREVKSRFVHPEDIALAMEPDSQGLGGRFRASDVHRDGA